MKIQFTDYKAYKEAQIKTNKKKLTNVWIDDTEINIICDYLKDNLGQIDFGLCHGSRNGYEVNKLASILNITVIGTDISDTCLQYPNMFVHDFHEFNINWHKKCDFIYTNSLDHSYNPHKFLINNLQHLKDNGILFVEHSNGHINATDYADCFGATLDEYLQMMNKYFPHVEILPINSNKAMSENRNIIICKQSKR